MRYDLGNIFKLPFGDTYVMNHYAKGMVYIENTFGESMSTFTDALLHISNSVKYGCIIPEKINVVCICNLKIQGTYQELIDIVKAIEKLNR